VVVGDEMYVTSVLRGTARTRTICPAGSMTSIESEAGSMSSDESAR
jgi:hypothetical protein